MSYDAKHAPRRALGFLTPLENTPLCKLVQLQIWPVTRNGMNRACLRQAQRGAAADQSVAAQRPSNGAMGYKGQARWRHGYCHMSALERSGYTARISGGGRSGTSNSWSAHRSYCNAALPRSYAESAQTAMAQTDPSTTIAWLVSSHPRTAEADIQVMTMIALERPLARGE
jgi:hypothetical protein